MQIKFIETCPCRSRVSIVGGLLLVFSFLAVPTKILAGKIFPAMFYYLLEL